MKQKPIIGRPKKDLDLDQFEKMAALGCPMYEIAEFFKMSDDTLRTRVEEISGQTFSVVYKRARAQGNISLRAAQFKKAIEKEDSVMLKWLGMQRLGQTDKSVNLEMQLQVPAIIERLNGEIIELGKLRKDEFNDHRGSGEQLDREAGPVELDSDAKSDRG